MIGRHECKGSKHTFESAPQPHLPGEKPRERTPEPVLVEDHRWDEASNGFYSICGEYQPAELVDGAYEISNGGQLFWFAALVNGDRRHASFDAQDVNASAALVADVNLENRA